MNFKEFKSRYQKKEIVELENQVDKTPLVSVCVQTFQHVSYIEKCLKGILMQKTDFSFEILLGEDGSSDGTREICIEYAKKYPKKIKLFLHDRANNISIEGKPTGRFNFLYNLFSANGKFIAICEGDDFWIDELKLQKQVDFLTKQDNYVISAHYCQTLRHSIEEPVVKPIEDMDFSAILLNGLKVETLSVLFKNNFNRNLPEWLIKCPNGDYPLFLIILESGGKVNYMEEVMACYRIHDGGMWSSNSIKDMGQKGINSMEICNRGFQYKYRKLFKKAIRNRRRKFGLLSFNLMALLKNETSVGDFIFQLRKRLNLINVK